MSTYEAVKGLGDTITCDECNKIVEDWFSGDSRAICRECYGQEPITWSELAELTHATQVERFNWCSCEEQEYFPYSDCPRPEPLCGDHLVSVKDCDCLR
jgi:RecJ-like exonuclease